MRVQGAPAGTALVDATDPSVAIDTITVVPVGGSQIQLLLRPAVNTNNKFRFIGSIRKSGSDGAVILQDAPALASNGVIGDPANPQNFEISVDTIRNIESANGIGANITASGDDFPGNITLIRSGAGGNITGNIAAAGLILAIEASGSIGTATRPSTVAVGQVLQRVQGTSIFANIRGYTNSTTPVADVYRLNATSGSFTGSLLASTLSGGTFGVPNIQVAGNLDANVTINGNVTKPIWVGGSLPSGKTLQIGGGGLQSQVIFNRANSSGSWAGTVRVDGTTLTANAYLQLSSTLGGGAA